jgi:hypothetical protein
VTDRLRLLIATVMVAVLATGFWYSISAVSVDDATVVWSEIDAATAAVEAWGSFAATGDIGLVEGWFSVDGPQYAQLLSEAESIIPGGVYAFALAEAVVVEPGLVRGIVTVTGERRESRTYEWDIELIHQDAHWKVWTVRTTAKEPET